MEILDDIGEKNIADNRVVNFKLIATGVLMGIGISTIYSPLNRIIELVFFEFNIFGFANIIPVHLLSILVIIVGIWITVSKIKLKMTKKEIRINRLFTHSVMFFIISFVIDILMPVALIIDERHMDFYNSNIQRIGQYTLISTGIEFAGYLMAVFMSIYLIIKIGGKK